MNIKALKERTDIAADPKSEKVFVQFVALLNELRTKELNRDVEQYVNDSVDHLNDSQLSGKQFIRLVKEKQTGILRRVEKEHKIVPKNYYRTIWMMFGMSGIGLPIGVAFGLSLGNIGLLGLGLPIGMGIGMAIGSSLDKKALAEGRQMNIEMKS